MFAAEFDMPPKMSLAGRTLHVVSLLDQKIRRHESRLKLAEWAPKGLLNKGHYYDRRWLVGVAEWLAHCGLVLDFVTSRWVLAGSLLQNTAHSKLKWPKTAGQRELENTAPRIVALVDTPNMTLL